MLKKRVIAIVIVKDGIVVQSKEFKKYLPVGNISITLEFLDQWGVDEIVLLDISATKNNRNDVIDNLQESVRKCFVPLTYGGGLNNIEIVHDTFKKGADKVSFNHAFFNNPDLVSKTASEFGQQSVMVSIDFIEKNGEAWVYNYQTCEKKDITLQKAIYKAESLGVGEILINCVNRDGMYNGFAIETVKSLEKSSVPLILAGGARTSEHFLELLALDHISAMAAGNMFHFVEHSVTKLKSNLESELVRKDAEFNYLSHTIISDQRINKLPDEVLESFLYEKLLDRDI